MSKTLQKFFTLQAFAGLIDSSFPHLTPPEFENTQPELTYKASDYFKPSFNAASSRSMPSEKPFDYKARKKRNKQARRSRRINRIVAQRKKY